MEENCAGIRETIVEMSFTQWQKTPWAEKMVTFSDEDEKLKAWMKVNGRLVRVRIKHLYD